MLLAEGDVPIVGAQVIGEYIDETRGVLKRERRLFAEDPMQRAEMRRLVDWFLTKMDSEVTRHLVRERVLKPMMPDAQGGGSPEFGGDPRGARQHPPASEIYQLDGRHAPLAGRRAYHLCRPCRRCRAFPSSTISAR